MAIKIIIIKNLGAWEANFKKAEPKQYVLCA